MSGMGNSNNNGSNNSSGGSSGSQQKPPTPTDNVQTKVQDEVNRIHNKK